jgi:PAS domain S-box-containing protein
MASFDWLISSGEMAALIKAKDWSKTSLGSPDTWSPTLRITINFLLANRFPVLLWWGPEYVQFYDDAFIPVLGAKHPKALGQWGSDCWKEIWPVLQPLVDTPFRGGPATWIEDLELDIRRSNFTEETHFTIAFSPVLDDRASGGIGGVLATVHEISEQVVTARRLAILRDLSARAMEAKTPEQSCVVAAKILEENLSDIPFALLYLLDAETKRAQLEGVAGVEAKQDISPHVIELGKPAMNSFTWPLDEVLHTESMAVVEDVDKFFSRALCGPRSDPPNTAVILPIRSNKTGEFVGAIVAGISSRLPWNDHYRNFFESLAAQIGTSIGNARAAEETHQRMSSIRKQAEDTLQWRTEQFETLLGNAPLGVYLIDSDFRIREANPVARALFRSVPDLIGRDFDQATRLLWTKELADTIIERFRHTMETGESYSVEEKSENRLGSDAKEFYEWEIHRIALPEGGHGVVCYFRDITHMVLARETIARSEHRLRLATEAAELGIWLWNFDEDQAIWENERPYEIFGRTYEDGPVNGAEFRKICHPEDLKVHERALANTLQTGARFFSQVRIYRKDGTIRWIEFNGNLRPRTTGSPLSILGTVLDITSRKQSEEAIRASENKLRMAHKAAHSGAWEWHLDSGQVVWSPEIEFLYGLPSGTFAGDMDAWRTMVHPEDLAKIERYLPAVYKDGTDLRMQFRITRMDGQIRWLEAVGQVVRDKQGHAQIVTGISTDVTERKAVEDKLRLTTERFELALRDSSIIVFNQDLDLRYTWIYNSNLGYEPWEVIGKRDTDLFERLEDAEVTESIKLDVIRTGISRRQEVVVRYLNVDRYYDLLVDPLKDSNGNITGVTCAAIDITERMQSEAALQRSEYRFRTLIESNIIPIVCANNQLITEANDAFLQMVGYTRDDLKAGKIDWVKMTPPEYKEKDLQALEQYRNCLFAAPYEKQFFRKDGTRVPIFIGAVVISQEPEEYLCFIIDLSELKRVEAELRKYQHELEGKVAERTLELTLSLAAVGSEIKVRKETEEQLRDLSGRLLRLQDEEHRRIARELHDSTGQTLSALKMSLSMLEKHVAEMPQAKALLEDLNMLADGAIQEIRTTSHLLHPPMLDDVGFSSAARWYLEGFAKRSGIDTTIDLTDLPDLTKDEELALFRILQESLTNVHRHSGSTSAEIRIYAEDESVILSIRDFGKGIPPDKLEKFNKTGAGVGVGLGGMKQRLHELGGNLEVRSEGKGITILAKLRKPKPGRQSQDMRTVLDPSIDHR